METTTQGHKKNFDTLSSAFNSQRVALIECADLRTNQKVAVICVLNQSGNGIVNFLPFAQMLEGDPTEYLVPPITDDMVINEDEKEL